MSTPNFYNKNASKVFANECEEDIDYDDLKLNLQSELEGDDIDDYDNERSYPGAKIKRIEKDFGKWNVIIEAVVRSGYYSGVNLDWEATVEEVEDWCNELNYDHEAIPRYIRDFIDRKIRKIEKVFKDNSTPLICRGVFSNGEAIYEKAN